VLVVVGHAVILVQRATRDRATPAGPALTGSAADR
jgi:hypothetical protein